MFCKNCGKKIENGVLFCQYCGTKSTQEIDNANCLSTDLESTNLTAKEGRKHPEKIALVLQKCCFGGLIAGIAGVALFLIIVLVGLIGYGGVYLFNGFNYVKVLSIISIVLMIIGLCSLIAKCLLYFVFHEGSFPTTIAKRILMISLAIACMGFSVWGMVDCSNQANQNPGYSSSSNGGSSSGGSSALSEYLGLSLSVTSIQTKNSYTYVYCSVKNVSSSYGTPTKYRYIKVKATFKDKYGSVVDTDWTYAIGSAWLNSGETKTFYYMVRNTSIKSATLSIMN